MASLSFYQQKYGKREGRKRYNAKQRAYRRRNRARINAAQRARYKALRSGQPFVRIIPAPSPRINTPRRGYAKPYKTHLGLEEINLAQLGLNGGRDYIRELVRIRDKRTCQECGKKWRKGMRRFDVHHQDEAQEGTSHKKGSIPIDRKSMDKMITLCHRCHLNLDSVRLKMRNSAIHS